MAFALALWYAARRGDGMVEVLLGLEEQRANPNFDESRLLALTVPLILMLLLAAFSLLAALLIQGRGANDFETGLQGISRLRREAQAGVSRTRSTTHVLEEFVSNARRAFRLQLWFTRILFLLTLTLFVLAVVDAIRTGVDLGTLGLAAGSILTLLLGVATGAAKNVGLHLGDATQLQVVVSNASRQVNVLEEHLFKVIEVHTDDPDTCRGTIEEGVRQIAAITDHAVELIQLYAEPPSDSKEQNRRLTERLGSLTSRGAGERVADFPPPAGPLRGGEGAGKVPERGRRPAAPVSSSN